MKIDTDRMRHGREVAAKLRGRNIGGIPWFAILDADGNAVATSDGPNGNVGFPVSEEEVRHFMQALREHTQQMTDADLQAIRQDLEGKGKH